MNSPGAHVWIWLGETPQPMGRIFQYEDCIAFQYNKEYLDSSQAIPLPDIPLQSGIAIPESHLPMHGSLRDSLPDSWGRKIVFSITQNHSEVNLALQSSKDRIGALDFQEQDQSYVPHEPDPRSAQDLCTHAQNFLATSTLNHPDPFTTAGGARPKATLEIDGRHYLAKFPKPGDYYDQSKAEFLALKFADKIGLQVPECKLLPYMNQHILLVERFDRIPGPSPQRRILVSALTLMGLGDHLSEHASYEHLAESIRTRFRNPKCTLHELFQRMVFNILVSNDDDHARNHAAFWDGEYLELTPAYDLCPRPIQGHAIQSMKVHGESRSGHVDTCLDACEIFHLDKSQAKEIIEYQIHEILVHWPEMTELASLSESESNEYWDKMFLRPEAIEL